MFSDVRPLLYAPGFSWWKRRVIPAFLPEWRLRFAEPADAGTAGTVLLWGAQSEPPAWQGRLLRVEDGFLRSVGLGADLIRPVSWVFDAQGMYYDATRPSDLECLLAGNDFDDALRMRAAALRERIVACGLTKYNVGAACWQRPPGVREVVLVTGQVESDASLALGAPGIRTNLALLQAVRAMRPDAFLVYKPHPDVLAGLRAQGADEARALDVCDALVMDAGMADLLEQVDEVHVLTSLAGFEALLRGKRVVCHGQPFYAGWGLTEDCLPLARRNRRLSLDQLVAGALILYPRYLSRRVNRLITPEEALDELLAWRQEAATEGVCVRVWRHLKRMVLRKVVGVR